MKKIFIIILVLFIYKVNFALNYKFDTLNIDSIIVQKNIELQNNELSLKKPSIILFSAINKQKLTALILDLLAGPIGGHRMALGTKPIVPIFYALTFGGGFLLLPLIDFFVILFTKDISKYTNNNKIIMWL